MGRANILFHLVNKFPIPNLSFYMGNVLRKSKYTLGKSEYSKQALFSMFAFKKGIISFFTGIVDFKSPFKTVLGKVLLNSTNLDSVLGAAVHNVQCTSIPKKVVDHANVQKKWIISSLGARVRSALNLNVPAMAQDLTISILREAFEVPFDLDIVCSFGHNPRTDMEWYLQRIFLLYSTQVEFYLRVILKDVLNIEHSKVLV